MGDLICITDHHPICKSSNPMPRSATRHWQHPTRTLFGVSNDKALAFYLCDVCGHDFIDLNDSSSVD